MSQTTPIQFEITSPTHLDKKIAEIQETLKTANLSWNAYSFGRAYRFANEGVDGARIYYPGIYQGDGKDYWNCFPNDNIKSYSFVYVTQPQDIRGLSDGFHYYTASLRVIMVFDLDEISTSYDYRYIELLKYDAIERLSLVSELTIDQVYDHIEDCFEGFTTEILEFQYLREKFGALRFDCSVNYETSCKLTNTY